MMVVLATGAWAADQQSGQTQGQGQQQPPPPPGKEPAQPGTPAVPAPPSPEELAEMNAFKAFIDDSDPKTQTEAGEAFLKKYPESKFRAGVYMRLAFSYRQLNEADKMFIAGEKALELNPDDLPTLSLMVSTIPRRVDPDALDGEQKLARAESYGRHALDLLGKLQKPEGVTDEAFAASKNQSLAMIHSGLGLVNFHRKQYADMVTNMEKATQAMADPEPVDLYLLGLGYFQVKRFSDAASTFERCANNPNPVQGSCQRFLAESKKAATAQPPPPKQQ
jgi:tetratricopeptide (TPR) repeat protein